MDEGTVRWQGSVSVVAAVTRYEDKAPVGVGRPVMSVARPARTEEQAFVVFVGVVAVADGERDVCRTCMRSSRRRSSPLKDVAEQVAARARM